MPYAVFKTFSKADGDIDGFLQNFERQCCLWGIAVTDWVTILVSKLLGQAAEAYRAVADEDCVIYEQVKEEILVCYL